MPSPPIPSMRPAIFPSRAFPFGCFSRPTLPALPPNAQEAPHLTSSSTMRGRRPGHWQRWDGPAPLRGSSRDHMISGYKMRWRGPSDTCVRHLFVICAIGSAPDPTKWPTSCAAKGSFQQRCPAPLRPGAQMQGNTVSGQSSVPRSGRAVVALSLCD